MLLKDHPLLHNYLRRRFAYLKTAELDVRLNWPDETELTGIVQVEGDQYFVGAYRQEPHRSAPDDYRALSREEGAAIDTYRAFRLLQPWPQPQVQVALSEESGVVTGNAGAVPVMMKEIGSSQLWWGASAGVIWEVMLAKSPFPDDALFRTAYRALWQQMEGFLKTQGVTAAVTEHADPAFATEWYQDVLREMGYQQVDGGAFRKEPL